MKKDEKELNENEKELRLQDVANNMLIDVDIVAKRVFANKKISKDIKEIRALLESINEFIYYFNSLDETRTTVFFQNIDMSKVYIPREFADFIIPAAVRRDPTDRRCRNLVKIEDAATAGILMDSIKVTNYLEYLNVVDSFRALFKTDMTSNTVALSELKRAVSTESVIDRLSYDMGNGDRVRYSGEPFVPLKLKYVGDEFEERYFTNTPAEVMTDWYAALKF